MTSLSDLPRDEWERRFAEHMIVKAGFTHFDDGESVESYAKRIAPSYWEDAESRGEGPEDSADADMSYWGEQ